MNIIEGLQEEIKRCNELLIQYQEIGPVGKFAYTMIKAKIANAEKMIALNDTVGMIKALEELKGCN